MPKSPEYFETAAYLVRELGNADALIQLNDERREAGLPPLQISERELALARKAQLMKDQEFIEKARRGDAVALGHLALLDAEIVTARHEEETAEIQKQQSEVDALIAAKPAPQPTRPSGQ